MPALTNGRRMVPDARVSFIVPVRNDAVKLATCLQSILANGLPRGRFEIIVADNGSSDGSADVARRMGADVMVAAGVRVSELRNLAARRTTGDIFAFIDADNEIVPLWGRTVVECLSADTVGAAGAVYQAPQNGTWVQQAYGVLRGRASGTEDVLWLGSGNLAIPRRVFDAVGGFDTSLEACEDVDVCNRIRSRGLRIVSDARLGSVHHGDPSSLWALFRGELWRGRDNLRVSFRTPVSPRGAVSAVIAVLDAVMIAIAVGGVILSLRGPRLGFMVAGAALSVVLLFAFLRAVRGAVRSGAVHPTKVLQVVLVTSVYDCARALALVARAPHRGRRSASPAVAS